MDVVTDVSSTESCEALADKVYTTHGACHLLFNNAGVAPCPRPKSRRLTV
jgi:NAD(P)-dependent dehydrogenase (short-subunit alcohol dehydrogenase family)